MKERKKSVGNLLKRVLLVVLCLVMALGTTVTIMAASFNGDLDGDGKVTAFDAQLLAEYEEGKRDLDPATVIGLTIRGILDRVLGKIVDEPVEEPSLADGIEKTFEVKVEEGVVTKTETFTFDMVTVTVSEGTKVTDQELTVTVKQKDASEGGITLEDGQELLPLDIHVEGVAADNTAPIVICVAGALNTGMNLGNLTLYHVENGEPVAMTQVMSAEELTAHNQFYYDPATGDITVAMATFSEVAVVSDTEAVWQGEVVYDWYDANETSFEIFNADQLAAFGAIVDGTAEGIAQDSFEGKTVTLCMDVVLSDGKHTDGTKPFDPIGYGYAYNGGKVFKGTFDGNGNTIKNLYQNGWSLGLSNSTAGGGLFASVCDATIKNLIMDNAYIVMECIDMGTVVGYAQGNCTFENIIVRKSTLANYQRYTGGVIGEVSNGHHTLNNVDVEASTTIGSLWGDFDNASGGLIGGKWSHDYDKRTGINHKVSVHMENCDVAAKLDVYNDVTSAYQWYSYRRCGMLIGMTEESAKDNNGRTEATASFLTTKNCTVQYGEWANYHYCEFGATTSLSARYPWVRVEEGNFCGAFSNPRYGVPTFDGKTLDVKAHTEEDGCHKEGDGHDVEIVFNQLYGGGKGVYGGNGHIGENKVTVLSTTGEIKPTTKFASKGVMSVAVSATVTLGELFDAVNGADIKSANVYAFVSPATETSTVRGTMVIPTADTEWDEREIKFTGTGLAKIVITDYYYCQETVLYVSVVSELNTVEKWVKVTDGSTLAAGDKIVIASDRNDKVAGAFNTEYLTAVEASFANGVMAGNAKAVVFTLDGTEGAWTLTSASGALGAAGGDLAWDSNTTWDISIVNGDATIENTNSSNGAFRYNTSSPRFNVYTSDITDMMQLPQLYRLEKVIDCAHAGNTTTTTIKASCTVTGSVIVTCDECGAMVSQTEIPVIEHNYVNGACSICGKVDATENKTIVFEFGANGNAEHKDGSDLGDSKTYIEDNYNLVLTDMSKVFGPAYDAKGNSCLKLGTDSAAGKINFTVPTEVTEVVIMVAQYKANTTKMSVNGTVYTITTASNNGAYTAIKVDTSTTKTVSIATASGGYRAMIDSIAYVIGEGSGETPCEHTNTTTTTVNATCTEAGSITVICDDCGETVSTETIAALVHKWKEATCEVLKTCSVCGATEGELADHNYVGGVCSVCGAEENTNPGGETEPKKIVFEFGANGSASHSDGSSKTSYSETVDGYTLNITKVSSFYTGARDAKGNSCIKLGTSSAAGKFEFTVPSDVTSVIIQIAKYKTNTTKISVNGTAYTLTNSSDNGAYDAITIDTTSNKTIELTTVSGGLRAMVNSITYVIGGGSGESGGEQTNGQWELVTAVSDLTAGDKIVIVSSNANYALSTTQNTNNRGQAAVTKNEDTVTFGADVQQITLVAGTTSGTWAFNVGTGYLYAASSSSNYLRTETTLSANSSWSISIASTGVATIKAQGSNTRNWLRYNSASSIFACYTSGQGDICIYKWVEN